MTDTEQPKGRPRRDRAGRTAAALVDNLVLYARRTNDSMRPEQGDIEALQDAEEAMFSYLIKIDSKLRGLRTRVSNLRKELADK